MDLTEKVIPEQGFEALERVNYVDGRRTCWPEGIIKVSTSRVCLLRKNVSVARHWGLGD